MARQVVVPIIRTKRDHADALARMEELILANNSKGDAELEVLGAVVEAYEHKKFPIKHADPIEALKFQMEQLGLNQTELAKELNITRGRASELLNRRRSLSLEVIRTIYQRFAIPASVLISFYTLTK